MATKKLRKGDTVHVANRLYAVVGSDGKLMSSWHFGPEIMEKHEEARAEACFGDGDRVLRLADVSGTIV